MNVYLATSALIGCCFHGSTRAASTWTAVNLAKARPRFQCNSGLTSRFLHTNRRFSVRVEVAFAWLFASTLVSLEPEGRYCHRHCTTIVPFWLSTDALSVKRNLSLLQSDIHWNPLGHRLGKFILLISTSKKKKKFTSIMDLLQWTDNGSLSLISSWPPPPDNVHLDERIHDNVNYVITNRHWQKGHLIHFEFISLKCHFRIRVLIESQLMRSSEPEIMKMWVI